MVGQLELGEALRDEGIQRVTAPEERQGWITLALLWIEDQPKWREFTAIELRAGVGDPPHPNCLGAVFSMASTSRGLIDFVGTTHSTRKERRASRLPIWRRL
jgi:hypothetical protein